MAAVAPCENAPYISIPVSKLFLFCFFNSTGNFFIPAELGISNMERDSNPVKSDRYFLFPFWLCSRTIGLIALFSQYISKYDVPVPGYGKAKGGWYVGRFALFRLFPVSVGEDVSYERAVL